MIPDYHIHTALCKHASGTMEEYVTHAIKCGLTEIAFTDHIPLPNDFDLAHRMHISEFEFYQNEILRLRQTYPQIKILNGIEADFYDGFEGYLDNFLQEHPFDLVIMSVHFLKEWPAGNWAFSYYFPDKTLTQIYNEYLSAVLRGIQTGLFDIIGHLDLIKSAEQGLLEQNQPFVEKILNEAQIQGMAIEINTSGLRKDIDETYPALNMLPLIQESGIPITFGSDAHAPDQVGLSFNKIEQKLKTVPDINLAQFKNRNLTISAKPIKGV